MSVAKRNRPFGKTAAALVGAAGLCALAVPLSPAKAQFYFGFGPGGFDIGVAPPAPYYAPPFYEGYGYPYYRPYRPYYEPYFYRW